MLVTLAAVVFFASIAVFFSQEFINAIKKIFAIRIIALFLPLFIASWVIFSFVDWFLWGAFYYREMLQYGLRSIASILPFSHVVAKELAFVLLLTAISILPVIIMDIFTRYKMYKPYKYPYLTSTIIWISSAVLLLVA